MIGVELLNSLHLLWSWVNICFSNHDAISVLLLFLNESLPFTWESISMSHNKGVYPPARPAAEWNCPLYPSNILKYSVVIQNTEIRWRNLHSLLQSVNIHTTPFDHAVHVMPGIFHVTPTSWLLRRLHVVYHFFFPDLFWRIIYQMIS